MSACIASLIYQLCSSYFFAREAPLADK